MPSKKVEPVDAHDEPEYKGHPINEELENGPMEKRSCTDILCCMLFIVFLGGMIGIASYSIKVGNPEIIGRGLDVDKKVCGISPGYENYPYLYFTVPLSGYLSQTICVSSCTPATTNTLSCKTNSLYANCVGTSEAAALAAGSNQKGKLWIYNNSPYLSRYCLPINADYAATVLSDALDTQLLEEWFTDVKTAWPVIAISAGAAFIIGLIYMILLRCCSGILTWGAILCFIGGTGVLGWRFYDSATSATAAASDNAKSQKIIAYILWGIAGVSALGVLCLYNRIRLAIAIIKAASQYVRNTLSVFLIPPVMVVILAAWYTFWIYTSLYLLSSGSAVASGTTPITSISFDKTLKTYMIYQLLALLWVNAFVLASVQFIIASSVCLWYFSQGTGQGAGATISKSVYRLFRYHFGSIAFGSLLVALIQTVRIILAYFQYQAKKLKGKDGKVVQFVFKCAQCYLACFERFIKFINKNAYIQIALTGKNFCRAAKDGFFLVLRNPLRISALATIGGVFIFFGKVFIAAVTALGAYIFVTKYTPYSTKINNPFIITLLVFIFAYAIAAVFMTIYGLAADTILAAFIVDEELSKKKNAPARHCPDVLKDFIEKHKKN